MKQLFKVWGSRTFAVAVLAIGTQHWGVPLYKQYFTPKKVSLYIPTAKAKEGLFTVSFHEMGTLKAEKSVQVNSEINGKLIYLIGEGAVVTPGVKLAEIDTSDLKREVLDRQLAYNNAKADIDRAKAEQALLLEQNKTDLAEQQAQYDFDSNEQKLSVERRDRMTRLYADKLVTRSEVDQADMEVRSKEFSVAKGKATLDLKKTEISNKEEQKKAEVRNVEFRAQMAKMSLEESQRRVDKAIIKSPATGMVVLDTDWGPEGRQKLQAGDQVRPEQTIITLPNLTSMQVKVQLGEADAPKIQVGLPVLVKLEAVPARVFHGTVREIASLATEPMPWERTGRSGKSFDVTIAIKEVEPKTLKPGMTADVEFLRKTVGNAVYVPLESVVESEGKTYVYVREGKKWRKTEVKLGVENDNFICVAHGVKGGQEVALRDPTRPIEDQEATAAGAQDETGKTKGKEAVPLPDSKHK